MIAPPPQLPLLGRMAGFRRFSVPEYHTMIQHGVLSEDDNVELIEGYLVNKLAQNPAHACSIQLTSDAIRAATLAAWCVRVRCAVSLSESEPEPDIAIVRGNNRSYSTCHPAAEHIGTLIEVAESTLLGDRADKGRIYARACVPIYWIVNLIDRQIEVYEQPSGPTTAPAYAKTTTFRAGDSIPLVLDGVTVATFPVQDLLP